MGGADNATLRYSYPNQKSTLSQKQSSVRDIHTNKRPAVRESGSPKFLHLWSSKIPPGLWGRFDRLDGPWGLVGDGVAPVLWTLNTLGPKQLLDGSFRS